MRHQWVKEAMRVHRQCEETYVLIFGADRKNDSISGLLLELDLLHMYMGTKHWGDLLRSPYSSNGMSSPCHPDLLARLSLA